MIEKLDNFFFKKIEYTELAIFRIVFALFLFFYFKNIFYKFDLFYVADTFYPYTQSIKTFPNILLKTFEGIFYSPQIKTSFFLVNFLSIIFLMLGISSRLCSLILFISLTVLSLRNIYILNYSDFLIRYILIIFLVLPLSNRISFKNLWLKRKPQQYEIAYFRILQVFVCLFYCLSVIEKLRGKSWIDGTAVYYALNSPEFSKNLIQISKDGILSKLLTYSSLAIEGLLGIFIILGRYRAYILTLGILFHFSLELFLDIRCFQTIMIMLLIFSYEPSTLINFYKRTLIKLKLGIQL